MLTCGVVIVKVEEAGTFNFPEFCYLMDRAVREDAEVGSGGSGCLRGSGGSGGDKVLVQVGYRETFRVFSKDVEGCIPAEEIR